MISCTNIKDDFCGICAVWISLLYSHWNEVFPPLGLFLTLTLCSNEIIEKKAALRKIIWNLKYHSGRNIHHTEKSNWWFATTPQCPIFHRHFGLLMFITRLLVLAQGKLNVLEFEMIQVLKVLEFYIKCLKVVRW